MAQNTDSPQLGKDNIRQFCVYAESVTTHAGESFLRGRSIPDTESELAVHSAYADGLSYAGSLTLNEVEDQAKELGISICRELAARRSFFSVIGGDLSPADFVASLYRDDRNLPEFWENSPAIAEATAFWQGMNDVYEFAVCFMNHTVYQDDFRRVRATVESSLEREHLLGVWQAASEIAYAEFAPPPPFGARIIPRKPPMGFDR